MKLVNKTIFYLFAIAMLLSSCEKEIDIKLRPSEPRIVVEGRIPFDSLAVVKITKTKDYGPNNEYPAINGAVVVISDDAGNSETLKQDLATGLYKASLIKGVQGRKYNLSIDVENQVFTSVSTMPYAVPIDSISILKVNSKVRFPRVVVQDPGGGENFYRFILTLKGKRMREVYPMKNENRVGEVLSYPLHFNSDENNDDELAKGDHILVEMQCIDKGVHKFFHTWAMMEQSLANPTSNIVGGALGYFSAYTIDRKETTADWND